MTLIQARVEIGEDRILHLQLPPDTPVGGMEIMVIVEPSRPGAEERERRRVAAQSGLGALRNLDGSTQEFLNERRVDEERRERALGL
jgi:hypothetical protein